MSDERIKLAKMARKRMLDIWHPKRMLTPRYKLFSKIMGLVLSDRLESAIINPTISNKQRAGFK